MRVLLTADLHYNHPRSRPLAEELIDRMNAAGGDVLVVVGDTGVGDDDSIERCLSRFHFPGPKLFVAGNHELWTKRGDSYGLFTEELPRRIRTLGWHWLETDPFSIGTVTFVGSVGWYDYSFAAGPLGIPQRFYAAKVSPGAARQLGGYEALFDGRNDIFPAALDVVARWNDGKFVSLGRGDAEFLAEIVARLESQLQAAATPRVIAAIHHVPLAELLPPPNKPQWDFAKAFLGSAAIGALLQRHPAVSHVFCGHSHMPCRATIGPLQAVNLGSGYRQKFFEVLETDAPAGLLSTAAPRRYPSA